MPAPLLAAVDLTVNALCLSLQIFVAGRLVLIAVPLLRPAGPGRDVPGRGLPAQDHDEPVQDAGRGREGRKGQTSPKSRDMAPCGAAGAGRNVTP